MAIEQYSISQHHGPTLKDYLLATRPQFLVATLLPVILGTAIGYQSVVEKGGGFDLLAFFLAIICVMFANLCINVLNDVYDDANGTDRINKHAIIPFTGGSRFIQQNILSRQQMRQWSYVLFFLVIGIGFLLFLHKGYVVLLFGLAGLFLGISYSMPPIQLASRGFGEMAIALGCGVVPILGASWLQSGVIGTAALMVAIPAGLWAANIVLVNELPDAQADADSGKRTLTVRFGDKATAGLYMLGNLVAVSFICTAAFLGLIPFAAILLPVIFLLPQIFVTDRMRQWRKDRQAFISTIKFNVASFVLSMLWITIWISVG